MMGPRDAMKARPPLRANLWGATDLGAIGGAADIQAFGGGVETSRPLGVGATTPGLWGAGGLQTSRPWGEELQFAIHAFRKSMPSGHPCPQASKHPCLQEIHAFAIHASKPPIAQITLPLLLLESPPLHDHQHLLSVSAAAAPAAAAALAGADHQELGRRGVFCPAATSSSPSTSTPCPIDPAAAPADPADDAAPTAPTPSTFASTTPRVVDP